MDDLTDAELMDTLLAPPTPFELAMESVQRERELQDRKWGPDRRLPVGTWHLILSEEVGEVAQASLGVFDTAGIDLPALRAELVQVAAVAVAMIEAIDGGRLS